MYDFCLSFKPEPYIHVRSLRLYKPAHIVN